MIAGRLPSDLADNALAMRNLEAVSLQFIRVLAEGAILGSGELGSEVSPNVILHLVVLRDYVPEVLFLERGRLRIVDAVFVVEEAKFVHVLDRVGVSS